MTGVLDSIELRMLRRADYLPTRRPAQYEILTAFRSCKRVTLQGFHALLSIRKSMESKTPFIRKYSVVL